MRSLAFLILICLCLTGCALDKQKHFAVGVAVSSWVYSETDDRSLACLAALGAGWRKKSMTLGIVPLISKMRSYGVRLQCYLGLGLVFIPAD